MPVGDNEAWLWCPVRPFSWEAFFKDGWGQNNLLEWCEWSITIPSRIEHFPSPSTSPFECTWDPNRRHWKKQTSEWKVLPSHLSSVNLLAQLWSILQSQGAKRGSVNDQLTSRCRSHNKNSFCQIFTITSRVIKAFKVTSLMGGWRQKPTIEHCIFQAASNNNDADKDKRMPCQWYVGFTSINGSQCEYL